MFDRARSLELGEREVQVERARRDDESCDPGREKPASGYYVQDILNVEGWKHDQAGERIEDAPQA